MLNSGLKYSLLVGARGKYGKFLQANSGEIRFNIQNLGSV
jgi:hypothetical protein